MDLPDLDFFGNSSLLCSRSVVATQQMRVSL